MMMLILSESAKVTKQAPCPHRTDHIVGETDQLKTKDKTEQWCKTDFKDWYQQKGLKDLRKERPDVYLKGFVASWILAGP